MVQPSYKVEFVPTHLGIIYSQSVFGGTVLDNLAGMHGMHDYKHYFCIPVRQFPVHGSALYLQTTLIPSLLYYYSRVIAGLGEVDG